MPFFEYTAFDANGRKKQGQIEADSERSARQLLRDQQLLPSEISSTEPKADKRKHNKKVPSKDIALFTQQFAALVQSNIPLEEALNVASSQTRNKKP